MLLLFKARRIADVVPFSNIPMQSHYAEAWVANYPADNFKNTAMDQGAAPVFVVSKLAARNCFLEYV
jgi:hypothetical protein